MNFFVGKPIDPGKLMGAVIEAIQTIGGEEDAGDGEERAA
jgi:hypothetical protein